MLRYLYLILIMLNIYSQNFIEVKGFNWKIDMRQVVLHSKNPFSIKLLDEKLKSSNASVAEALNLNGYYLVNIRNNSKTFIIYQKQIEKLKKLNLFDDIIPIFQFKNNTTVDIHRNSIVKGFTQFKNDSIYRQIKLLQKNINACFERDFRLNQNLQKAVQVSFEIIKGKTEKFRIVGTDIKNDLNLNCVKRILQNQYWGNETAKGIVNYSFIVHQPFPRR